MLGSWALIAALAYAASRIWWRDDLSRSLIGAVALVLFALSALAIFGVKGPRTLLAVLAAFGAVVAVGGGTVKVDALLSDGPPEEEAIVNCPPDLPGGVQHGFVADTDLGYSLVRTEPNLSARLLLKYPSGCRLEFTSYCIGEPKIHWRFGTPDPVWFHALGDFRNGYIPAADIRAGPGPNSLDREVCEEGEPSPKRPEITTPLGRELKGPIEIAAAVPNAIEVGFAAYYEDLPGRRASAAWHQIGVDLNTDDGITTDWDTRSIPGQSRRGAASMTLAVVPCLGLDFPYYERPGRLSVATRTYAVANRGGPPADPVTPPADSMPEAGETACNNQVR